MEQSDVKIRAQGSFQGKKKAVLRLIADAMDKWYADGKTGNITFNLNFSQGELPKGCLRMGTQETLE